MSDRGIGGMFDDLKDGASIMWDGFKAVAGKAIDGTKKNLADLKKYMSESP
jgi:hypothetical protein